MRDIEITQDGAQFAWSERIHRQVTGQRDRQAVHLHAIDHVVAVPGAVRAAGRSERVHLVPGRHQMPAQVVHLHLDTAQPRQVAVGEQGDLHGATVVATPGNHSAS